jgi:hypothetical protein
MLLVRMWVQIHCRVYSSIFLKPGPIKFRELEMESVEKRRWKDETSNYSEEGPIKFSKLGPIKFRKEDMES